MTHARAPSPAAATDLLRSGPGKGPGTGSRERDRDCVQCRHLPGLGNPSSGTCSCVLAGEPREGEGPSAGPASARVTWCRWQRQHRCARAGAARRRASGGEVLGGRGAQGRRGRVAGPAGRRTAPRGEARLLGPLGPEGARARLSPAAPRPEHLPEDPRQRRIHVQR